MEKILVLSGIVEWFANHIALYIDEEFGTKVHKSTKALIALLLSCLLVFVAKVRVGISGYYLVDMVLTAFLVAFGSRAIHEFYKVFNRK